MLPHSNPTPNHPFSTRRIGSLMMISNKLTIHITDSSNVSNKEAIFTVKQLQ